MNHLTRIGRQSVRPGDVISVSAVIDGREALRLTLDDVWDLSSVISRVRSAGRYIEGLARLRIINSRAGWVHERLFRFYRNLPGPAHPAIYEPPRRRCVMPWETH